MIKQDLILKNKLQIKHTNNRTIYEMDQNGYRLQKGPIKSKSKKNLYIQYMNASFQFLF